MNKKYLGLGFTFAAIDNGLKNAFRQVSNQFHGLEEDMDNVNKRGTKWFSGDGVFGRMMDFAKLGMMGRMSGQMKEMMQAMMGGKTSDQTFAKLERFIVDMRFTGKMTAEQAKVLKNSLLDISASTGALPEDMAEVVTELMNTGVAADKLNKGQLKKMGELMGVFNMNAKDVTEMFRIGLSPQMELTADQMDGLIKKSVNMAKVFGFTPQLDKLPKILDVISKKTAFMGGLRGEDAAKATEGIQTLALMFQKLGKEAGVAGDMSVDMFSRAKDIQAAFAKTQAGLGGELSDLYKQIVLTAPDLAAEAVKANDPTVLFKQLQEGMKRSQKLGKQTFQDYMVWLNDAFGPDIVTALTSDYSEVQKSLDKATTMDKKKLSAYDEYVAMVKETVSHTKNVAEAAEAAMKIQQEFATSKEVKAGLNKHIEAYKKMADELERNETALAKMANLAHIFEDTGIVGVVTAFGDKIKVNIPILSGLVDWITRFGASGAVSMGVLGDSIDKIVMNLGILGFAINAIKWPFQIIKGLANFVLKTSWSVIKTPLKLFMSGITALLPKVWMQMIKDIPIWGQLYAEHFLKGFKGGIGKGIVSLLKYIPQLISMAARGLSKVWGLDAAEAAVKKKAGGIFNRVWMGLKSYVTRADAFIMGWIKGLWAKMSGKVVEVFSRLISPLKGFAMKGGTILSNFLFKSLSSSKAIQWITKGFSWAFRGLGTIFKAALRPLFLILDAVYILWRDWNGFIDSLSKADTIGEKISIGIKFAIGVMAELIDDFLFGIPSMITEAFSGISFRQGFELMFDWIKYGINMLPSIGEKVFGGVMSYWEGFKKKFYDSIISIVEMINSVIDKIPGADMFGLKNLKVSDESVKSLKDMAASAGQMDEAYSGMAKAATLEGKAIPVPTLPPKPGTTPAPLPGTTPATTEVNRRRDAAAADRGREADTLAQIAAGQAAAPSMAEVRPTEVNITIEGDMSKFMRVLKKYQSDMAGRAGTAGLKGVANG